MSVNSKLIMVMVNCINGMGGFDQAEQNQTRDKLSLSWIQNS